MTTIIYDKTEKGHEEIQTRQNHLPSRLRSLLVLVDGKTSVDALLKKIAGLGLNEESIAELLQQGFIAPHATQNITHSDVENAAPPAADSPTPNQQNSPQQAPSAAPSAILAEGESLYQALYNFYGSFEIQVG